MSEIVVKRTVDTKVYNCSVFLKMPVPSFVIHLKGGADHLNSESLVELS